MYERFYKAVVKCLNSGAGMVQLNADIATSKSVDFGQVT